MTPKERAAMQQALGALEICNANVYVKGTEAITALREALVEQAEQEPVACGCGGWEWCSFCNGTGKTDLYAAPVQQVDLTDDEITKATEGLAGLCGLRAVIAAYKEKNRG